jgi:hypothetical protein
MRPARRLTPGTAFATLELAANLVFEARCKARAEVAELADAHGSGPCTRKGVEVQVLSSAPRAAGFQDAPVRNRVVFDPNGALLRLDQAQVCRSY